MKTRTLKIILATFLIALVLGIYIGRSQTPTSTFYISPGPYPGSPTFTIWREGSNFFAKTGHGELKYSGTNSSQVINNAIGNGNVTVFLKNGDFGQVTLQIKTATNIIGESVDGVILRPKGDGTPVIKIDSATRVTIKNLHIKGDGSSPGAAIQFYGTSYNPFLIYIRNILIEDCEYGIYSDVAAWALKIKNIHIIRPQKDGINWGVNGIQNRWEQIWVQRVPSGYWAYKGGLLSGFLHISAEAYLTGGNGVLLKSPDNFEVVADIEALTRSDGLPVGIALALGDPTPTWWGSGKITLFVKDVDTAIALGRGALSDKHIVKIWYRKSGTVNTLLNMNNYATGYIKLENYVSGDTILNAPTNRVLFPDTPKYVNSGTASGTSPITVAHGLAGTPDVVVVSANADQPYALSYTADSTHIVIYHNATVSVTVSWYAKYEP